MSKRNRPRKILRAKLPHGRYQWKIVFEKGPHFVAKWRTRRGGEFCLVAMHAEQENMSDMLGHLRTSLSGAHRLKTLPMRYSDRHVVDYVLLENQADVMMIKMVYGSRIRQIYQLVLVDGAQPRESA